MTSSLSAREPPGCVLARRLVDTGAVSVLLVEAGPKVSHPYIRLPAGFTKLTGSALGWGYGTVPQKGLHGKEVWYPQGKVLAAAHQSTRRCTRAATAGTTTTGRRTAARDSYAEVLPYFRKSEDNNRYANEYHGQGGPQQVSDPVPHLLTTVFVRAARLNSP